MTASATTLEDLLRTTTGATDTRGGFRLLLVGLALGAAADTALRGMPWGLGATVMTTALLGCLLWLQMDQGTRAGAGRYGYVLAALVFGAGFAWRDAPVLKLLDFLGLVVSLGLLASEREALAGPASVGRYAVRILGSMGHATVGPPLLATADADWSGLRLRSLPPLMLALGRGLALTLPLLLIFAALLGSADAVFAQNLSALTDVDLFSVAGHLVGIAFWSWIAAGLLRAAVLRERPLDGFPARPSWLTVGRIEVGMLLGSLDLLFAAFVWVQFRYLFGGARRVQEVAGLTYAEYARRGFFELVAVAGLVLAVLLAAHWIAKPETAAQKTLFGALAGGQVLLVFVMLASALERMRLYREEYGLTELRFYTVAFMAWVGALLFIFLFTVLRDRRDLFARGLIGSAFLAVVVLNALDPDARIVRTNANLPRGFDVRYARELSADAIPALVETLPSLDPERRAFLEMELARRWSAPDRGWPAWSAGRARARQALDAAAPGFGPRVPVTPEAPTGSE